MSTLLLRFAAPMQAWGSSSRFQWRETNNEPTKSAVIGMLAAALGRRRTDSIADLADIRFGVRLDQPGRRIKDFHTAKSNDGKQAFTSHRRYLSDAVFLVGIQDDPEKLQEYENALIHPYFPLFLGRRSCPPVQPFILGIRHDLDLLSALQSEPWQASRFYQRKMQTLNQIELEIVLDAQFQDVGAYTQYDLPLTFDQTNRRYTSRSVISQLKGALVQNQSYVGELTSTEHDALGALGVE